MDPRLRPRPHRHRQLPFVVACVVVYNFLAIATAIAQPPPAEKTEVHSQWSPMPMQPRTMTRADDVAALTFSPANLAALHSLQAVAEVALPSAAGPVVRWGKGYQVFLGGPVRLLGKRFGGWSVGITRLGLTNSPRPFRSSVSDPTITIDTGSVKDSVPGDRLTLGYGQALSARWLLGGHLSFFRPPGLNWYDSDTVPVSSENTKFGPSYVGAGLSTTFSPLRSLSVAFAADMPFSVKPTQNLESAPSALHAAPELRLELNWRAIENARAIVEFVGGVRGLIAPLKYKDGAGEPKCRLHIWKDRDSRESWACPIPDRVLPRAQLRVTDRRFGISMFASYDTVGFVAPGGARQQLGSLISVGLDVPVWTWGSAGLRIGRPLTIRTPSEKFGSGKGLSGGDWGVGARAQVTFGPAGSRLPIRAIPWGVHFFVSQWRESNDFYRLLQTLRARAGEAAEVIILHVPARSLTLAQAEALRRVVLEIRQRWHDAPMGRGDGREVVAYLEGMSLSSYYLASACNRIYLHPGYPLAVSGAQSGNLYFGDALAQLGLTASVVQSGEPSLAAERWARSEPSPVYRGSLRQIDVDRWNLMVEAIPHQRNVSVTTLVDFIDLSVQEPAHALEQGLVDALVWPDELDYRISIDRETEHTQAPYGAIAAHDDALDPPRAEVVVVPVRGELMDGIRPSRLVELTRTTVSIPRLVETLESLRDDGRVKAVVLDVASVGGSAWAGETLRRAIEELARRKPVVIAIAEQATGSAYYASLAGNRILATGGSVVGGIGAFRMEIFGGDLLKRLGISAALYSAQPTVESGQWCREHASDRIEVQAQDAVQRFVASFYQELQTKRPIAAANLGPGVGNILTGARAQQVGFVDELGDLAVAIDVAQRLANYPFALRTRYLHAQPHVSLATSALAQELGIEAASLPELSEKLQQILGLLQQLPGGLLACSTAQGDVYSVYESY